VVSCASHAASRSSSVSSRAPVTSPTVRRDCALVRRVFCATCWCSSHSVRRFGSCPPCAAFHCSTSRASSGPIDTARELNLCITLSDTPPISQPFPSARGTITNPRSRSHFSANRSGTGARPSRCRYSARLCSVRYLSSSPSARCTRFQIDRDVHVQVRVAVAGQMVQEQGRRQAPGLPT
jgi:hypothetical protein